MATWNFRVLEVVRVVDGDTADLRVDVGFRLTAVQRFRFLGVNCPETGTPGASEATAYSRAFLEQNAGALYVVCHGADNFGRWLADVRSDSGASLGELLLSSGHAVPFRR